MHKANKQAAQFLKARLLLNKAVYKADPKAPTTFTFAPADMDQVVTLVNAIEASGKFALSTGYWDNFKWDNYQKSTELILSRASNGPGNKTQTGGNTGVTWATGMGTHYNQAFSGWNGFTTTADFYNSFPEVDKRRQADITNYTELTGFNAGFLAGQQYKYDKGVKVKVKDRSGSDLVFTPEVSLFFSTESKGIRTMKYPMEFKDGNFNVKNDYVFFRYADALLMKAEAILRGGTATGGQTALSIVNEIRARSGAAALKTVGLINIQFAIKDDTVYIIEANPRASRTVPFIAKAYGEPYVNYATKVMLGHNKVTDFTFNPQLKGYAIKQPVFSFSKFPNVNKALGPEMKSTGESILFIDDLKDDQFYDLYSRRKMYLTK